MRPPRLRTGAATTRDSDAELERKLRALKAQYADGRLSTEELEARVEDVYRSRTQSGVAVYVRDWPLQGVRQLIVGRAQRIQRAVLKMHLLAYVTANASLVAIWALTGGVFWPAWLLVPSTALLGWHVVASRALTRALRRHSW